MTDTNNGSANQGQAGGEKLIDGKTVEQILAENKNLTSQVNNLNESLNREKRVNELIEQGTGHGGGNAGNDTGVSMADYGLSFEDENQKKKFESYVEANNQAIYRKVDSLVDQKIGQRDKMKSNEEYFYKRYPKLKGFEADVNRFAAEIQAKYGKQAAAMNKDDLFKEVASKVVDYHKTVAERYTKSTVHIEGGSLEEHGEPVEMRDNKPKTTSEEDRAKAFFDKEVPDMNKKKLTPMNTA